jgi:hypothetical protein
MKMLRKFILKTGRYLLDPFIDLIKEERERIKLIQTDKERIRTKRTIADLIAAR